MKKLSDGLFLLALVLLVVAILTSTPVLYVLSGVALVASIVTTSMKRRRAKAARPT